MIVRLYPKPGKVGDGYWRAKWTDETGIRHTRGLGAVKSMSRRDAERLCAQITTQESNSPTAGGKSPTLTGWRDWYQSHATKSDGAAANDAKTFTYLIEHFGDIRIDRITQAHAREFRKFLAGKEGREGKLSETTIRNHIRRCKAIFAQAVKIKTLRENPFAEEASGIQRISKQWADLTTQQVKAFIEACPTSELKALVGLCAYAGLRRGEALAIRRSDIQWDKRRLIVQHGKGEGEGRHREVFMEPVLESLLLELLEQIDGDLVAPVSTYNLHRILAGYQGKGKRYIGVMEKAGLPTRTDPLQNLRRWRDSTWKLVYPEYIVDAWLGHSQEVSRSNYLKVPETFYATVPKVFQNSVQSQ